MTRDQKPGKVRVIGQRDAGRPAHPMRRATDIDPNAPQGSEDDRGTGVAGGAGAVGAANGAESESTSKGGGMALLPILFFLLACAGGGVAFTLFALPALAR
jgi:hypothetical protein